MIRFCTFILQMNYIYELYKVVYYKYIFYEKRNKENHLQLYKFLTSAGATVAEW